MRIRTLAVLVAALVLAGCYRVTVVTAAPPATIVDKPWQNSFIYGLVPPPELNVREQCPRGVAKVMTQRSFLNQLVAGLTFDIYTPMQVTVTCAGT